MNEYRHYRGRGRGNYQHGNNYRNQLGNNLYGSDVRRCNPNHFTPLLPFSPFRDTRPRWQRPPLQHNWRGAPPPPLPPRHYSYVRPYSPTNNIPKQQTRPLSPLPGSEEARQKAIAEASARIKQQLNLSEGDVDYEKCNNIDETQNISDDCIILNELPTLEGKNILVNNKVQDKKKKHKKCVNNTTTIEELRKKILTQFTYMSKGKIQNLVNNPGSTRYDNALQHLVRDMRLHLSSELRNMYTNRDADPTNEHNKMIDHFNSIVPDLGIELVSLPDTMVAELSKILQLDVNNEIEEEMNTNENVLVEPEDMFKQAEKLLSSTDFLNVSFETINNENDNNRHNPETDNIETFVHHSPVYNCPPPNINKTQVNQFHENVGVPSQFQQDIRFDEDSIVYDTHFFYSQQFRNEPENFTNATSFSETVVPSVPPIVPTVPVPLKSLGNSNDSNINLNVIPLPQGNENLEKNDEVMKETTLNLNIPLPETPEETLNVRRLKMDVRDDSSPFSKKILQDPIYEDAFNINSVNDNYAQSSEQQINKSECVLENNKNILFDFDSVWVSKSTNKNIIDLNVSNNQTTITTTTTPTATTTTTTDISNNKLNVTSFLQDVIKNNLLELPSKDKASDFIDKQNKFISETSCESSKSLTEKSEEGVRPFNRTRSHSPYDLKYYSHCQEDKTTTKNRLSLDERIKEMMKIQESRVKPKDQQVSPTSASASTSSKSTSKSSVGDNIYVIKIKKKRERKLMQMKRKQQLEKQKQIEREKQKEIERIKQIEREKRKKIEERELDKVNLMYNSANRNNKIHMKNVDTLNDTNSSIHNNNDVNVDNTSLTSNLLNLKNPVSAISKIPIKLISKTKSKTETLPEIQPNIDAVKIKEELISEEELSPSSIENETETSIDNLSEKSNIINNSAKDVLNPTKCTKNIRHFESIENNLNITNKILETVQTTSPVNNIEDPIKTTTKENESSENNNNNKSEDVSNKKETLKETENNIASIEKDETKLTATQKDDIVSTVNEQTQIESSNEVIVPSNENENNIKDTQIVGNEEKRIDTTKDKDEIIDKKNNDNKHKKSEVSSSSNHKKSSSKKVDDNKKHRHGSVDRKKEESMNSKTSSKVHKKTDSKHKTSSSSSSHHHYHHHQHNNNNNNHINHSDHSKQKIISRLLDIDLQIQKLMQEKWNLYKELNISNIEQLPIECDLNRSKHSKMPRLSPESKSKETTTIEIKVKNICTQTETETEIETEKTDDVKNVTSKDNNSNKSKGNSRKRKLSESGSSIASSNIQEIEHSVASDTETKKLQKLKNNKSRVTRNSVNKIDETIVTVSDELKEKKHKNIIPKLKINLSNVKNKTIKHAHVHVQNKDESTNKIQNEDNANNENDVNNKTIKNSNKKLRNKKILEDETITSAPNTNNLGGSEDSVLVINTRKRTAKTKKPINLILDEKPVVVNIKNCETIENKNDDTNDEDDIQNTTIKRKTKKENDEDIIQKNKGNRKKCENRNSRNRSMTPSIIENKNDNTETATINKRSRKRKNNSEIINDTEIKKTKPIKNDDEMIVLNNKTMITHHSDDDMENLLGFTNIENETEIENKNEKIQELEQIKQIEQTEQIEHIEMNVEKETNETKKEEIEEEKICETINSIEDVTLTTYNKLMKTCFVQLERINVALNEDGVEENEENLVKEIDVNNEELLRGNVIDANGMFCMGHQKSILDIKIVGDEFFAASEDGTIYKYCLKSGTLQDAYTGHKRAVTCIYTINGSFLNIESTLLYSGSLDCTLKCYNIETAEVVHSVTVAQAIQCLDSAWGYIFLGTYEGLLFIYDMKKKILNENSLTIANATVLMIKATQEGSRQVLILASRKREIMVRDAFTGLLLRTMCEEQKPTIYSLLLDRSMVYCGTSDKGIIILDFNNGQQIGLYNCGKGVVCMLMYRCLLFAGCYDGLIYIYNTKTQRHVTTIPGPGEGMLLSLAISNDVIVAGSKKDHLLKIWKIPQEIFNQID